MARRSKSPAPKTPSAKSPKSPPDPARSAAAKKAWATRRANDLKKKKAAQYSVLTYALSSCLGVDRTSWPPESRTDVKRRALLKDAIVLPLFVAGIVLLSQVLPPLPVPSSPLQVGAALACATLQSCIHWMEIFGADKMSDRKVATVGVIGHAAYFTVQTIFASTAYFLVVSYSILFDDGAMWHATVYLSTWLNAQCVALTLLFFLLNWNEPKWREEVLKVQDAESPGIGRVLLFTHVPPALLALVNAVVVQSAAQVMDHGMQTGTYVKVAVIYGMIYTFWLKLMQRMKKVEIYPFVEDLSTPLRCAVFIALVGMGVVVIGLVMEQVALLTF